MFDPWVRKIPWSRKWQLVPVFLLGKLHGQRSLVGYCPWGHKELDMTERLSTCACAHACACTHVCMHTHTPRLQVSTTKTQLSPARTHVLHMLPLLPPLSHPQAWLTHMQPSKAMGAGRWSPTVLPSVTNRTHPLRPVFLQPSAVTCDPLSIRVLGSAWASESCFLRLGQVMC